MKTLLTILFAVVAVSGDALAQKKFSDYPNSTTLQSGDLFIFSRAGTGTYNIDAFSQMPTALGLGTAAYTASTDYDAAGLATAATNALGLGSGLSANVTTNRWITPAQLAILSNNINGANIFGTVAIGRFGLSAPASLHTNILMFKSDGSYIGYDLADLLALTGGASGVTSINVAQPGFSSSGAVTTSGTVTLTRNADVNNLNFAQTNLSRVGIGFWHSFTNATGGLEFTNVQTAANLTLLTNGTLNVGGIGVVKSNQVVSWAGALNAGQFLILNASLEPTNTVDGGALTNLQKVEMILPATSQATNYTINVAFRPKQKIFTANTNANFTFSNIGTNKEIDLYIDALTSTVPCNITFPPHVVQNHYASLTVTNGQSYYYHIDFWDGTDPTNTVVTGGDYYQRQ